LEEMERHSNETVVIRLTKYVLRYFYPINSIKLVNYIILVTFEDNSEIIK